MVGPDNGVLTMPMQADAPCKGIELTAREYFLDDVGPTFHGRDVFAPVAAHLSRGVALMRMGRPINEVRRLDVRRPVSKGGAFCGEIVHVDRFGNAITNLPASGRMGRRIRLGVGGVEVQGLAPAYESGSGKQLIAVINSLGLIELAVRGGSAADRFRLKVGQSVELKFRRPSIDP